MTKSKGQNNSKKGVEGLAAGILKEVIRAEMSMHDRQIEAWQWMAKNRPYAEHMDKDILQGLSENKYLSMEEVNLSFHIIPVSKGFVKRLKTAFRILRGKEILQDAFTYEFCSASHPDANNIEIRIKRNSDGSFKSSVSKNKSVVEY